ncbi:anti-sigma factor family protein [Candidatus Mycolicibacterium alkanivorans]|uniref:Zf-HC2 domain-containing protein n=1 Tax=Candidatus Mycolicibacterium alkanivorans TaxID=2954114 RepID=A0ABS9Z1Y3_9MYCO|nr:zf-HC2 domain-containing protein [Candidatus Mycolicibacterium alkanivorans]MCI4676968.1 zf-HC2 domain-containing protein [Candidatus Mycolicibacterium alkanivorans]
MTETDTYAPWDAAYVLGSLSSNDRREYEAHLNVCPSCRSAVGELSGMPAMLAMLSPDEVASIDDRGLEPPPMRPELLDEILHTVQRQRRRSRWITWTVSAAAAAVLAVAALLATNPAQFGLTPLQLPGTSASAPLSMTPVTPSSFEATVVVTGQGWGTQVEMTCTYGEEPGWGEGEESGDELAMYAVGRDGGRVLLATWTARAGATASPSGSTSMPLDEIAAVQVVSVDTGDVLLQRRL